MYVLTPMVIETQADPDSPVVEKLIFVDMLREKIYSSKSNIHPGVSMMAVDISEDMQPVIDVIRQKKEANPMQELSEELITGTIDISRQRPS